MLIRIVRIVLVLLAVVFVKDLSPPYKHIDASPLNKQFVQRPVVQPPPAVKPAESPKPEQARLKETPPKTNREIGQELSGGYGWTGEQWICLERLWTGESNWDHTNWNGKSAGIPWNNNRATGIPQSLPASKMATEGSDYMTNPSTQIKWGLAYIKRSYGTPCGALNFWNSQSPHWY